MQNCDQSGIWVVNSSRVDRQYVFTECAHEVCELILTWKCCAMYWTSCWNPVLSFQMMGFWTKRLWIRFSCTTMSPRSEQDRVNWSRKKPSDLGAEDNSRSSRDAKDGQICKSHREREVEKRNCNSYLCTYMIVHSVQSRKMDRASFVFEQARLSARPSFYLSQASPFAWRSYAFHIAKVHYIEVMTNQYWLV